MDLSILWVTIPLVVLGIGCIWHGQKTDRHSDIGGEQVFMGGDLRYLPQCIGIMLIIGGGVLALFCIR